MCPACIGSALLLLTGTTSAGGLALIASRTLGTRTRATGAYEAERIHKNRTRHRVTRESVEKHRP